jgi:indole-3-glycerol phosphate synthase
MIAEILKTKQKEIEALKKDAVGPRKRPVREGRVVRPLVFDGGTNIIAELKRRSPSAGYLSEITPERISVYGRYAKAVSVLTDATYFGGSYEFLNEVAGATSLPVLCKDFIIDRVQIDRAYAAGADLVLLIARILTKEQLFGLYAYARELGIECLIELHDRADAEKVDGMHPSIVGVNGRDLDTLEIDLDKVADMLACVTAPFRIAESGIRSRQDIERMQASGANGFLIGETLMRSDDPETVFGELLHG